MTDSIRLSNKAYRQWNTFIREYVSTFKARLKGMDIDDAAKEVEMALLGTRATEFLMDETFVGIDNLFSDEAGEQGIFPENLIPVYEIWVNHTDYDFYLRLQQTDWSELNIEWMEYDWEFEVFG